MYKVGDKIKILNMRGEPQYAGKEGIIERMSKDPYGEMVLYGTWGGLAVYPCQDTIKIIEKVNNS